MSLREASLGATQPGAGAEEEGRVEETLPAVGCLQLDARQRAMLAEMGVRLWWPQAVAAEVAFDQDATHSAEGVASSQAAISVAQQSATAQPTAASVHNQQLRPVPEPRVQTAPARAAHQTDSQAPRPAARAQPPVPQQAHALLGGAFAPASAAQVTEGMRWLLVLDPPGLSEHAAGEPAAQADVRRLLLNMMAAVRLDAAQAYHLCAAQAVVAPGQMLDEAALVPWRASLAQEIRRLQPQLLLCLGRHAAYCVLGSQAPLGQLRGQAHRMAWPAAVADASAEATTSTAAGGADIPVVVSYPPAYLLRNPAAKRQAWQDLCLAHALAQEALQGFESLSCEPDKR
ncbi:MAG: uracil-DNA glycosylase family protein [Brachymonas sp.]|nr:uracil-DNA glycosylase family protein [Brachymonas sp.]